MTLKRFNRMAPTPQNFQLGIKLSGRGLQISTYNTDKFWVVELLVWSTTYQLLHMKEGEDNDT